MSYDSDNIFAKIIRGEMPCTKVYEDEHTIAFMDVMPQAEGHQKSRRVTCCRCLLTLLRL